MFLKKICIIIQYVDHEFVLMALKLQKMFPSTTMKQTGGDILYKVIQPNRVTGKSRLLS